MEHVRKNNRESWQKMEITKINKNKSKHNYKKVSTHVCTDINKVFFNMLKKLQIYMRTSKTNICIVVVINRKNLFLLTQTEKYKTNKITNIYAFTLTNKALALI